MSKIDLDKFIGALREHLGYLQHNLVDAIDASLREQGIGIYDRIVVKEGEQKDPCENCVHQMLNCQNFPCDKKQGKLKSAEWSDEDEIMLNRIGGWLDTLCDYLRDSSSDCIYDVHKSYSWLKSIKRRVQPKQEWSHYDNIILETIEHEIERIPAEDFIDFAKDRCLEWLRHRVKYLNPHNAWKPSEEQMEIIDMVLSNEAMDDNVARVLRELKEELKKL